MKPRSQTPRDEGPFLWVARDAAEAAGQLGITAFAVYCALAYFESQADSRHKQRFAASLQQVATLLAAHPNTIKSALKALKEAGLVKVFTGRNQERQVRRNSFFLVSLGWTFNGHQWTFNGQRMKTSDVQRMRTLNVHIKEKEQLGGGPQARTPNRESGEGSACSPLRGGSALKEPPVCLLTPEQLAEVALLDSL
jgi:hypothetical protein